MIPRLLLAFLAAFILIEGYSCQNNDYVRFCYFTNWAQYRPEPGKFWPEDIDPFLCTNIVYAFAIVDENNEIATFEWNDEELYSRLQALKTENPDLKTHLGVGGWNFGMNQTTQMLETPETRATFIDSAMPFLRLHGFDGLDLDFEYPGNQDQGGRRIDKFKFTALVNETRLAFEAEAASSGDPVLMLTAAVPAGKQNIDDGYQVAILSELLDYMNVMTYDLHGAWSNYTGINAPLYPRAEETGTQRNLNVDFAIRYYLDKGAIKEKLVVGLAFFGRCFTLASTDDTGLGAPAVGAGPLGPYTGEAGFYAYYEICSSGSGNKEFDDEHLSPYAWRDDVWVGYDDKRSLACKAQYIMDMDLAGFFVWAIDLDDFDGSFCNDGPFPLFNHVIDVMDGDVWAACSNPAPSTTTTSGPTTTTTASNIEDFCDSRADGLYAHPTDCTQFIQCVGDEEFPTGCPSCLIFDEDAKACDFPCDEEDCYPDPCNAAC